MTEISILNKNVQKVHEWLSEISSRANLHIDPEAKAIAVLRATLQEIRDNISVNDLAHLSAQLPLLIRGLLFEAWMPARSHERGRKKEDFLQGVYDKLPEIYRDTFDIEIVVRTVLNVLYYKIDPNEVEKVKSLMPKNIKALFP